MVFSPWLYLNIGILVVGFMAVVTGVVFFKKDRERISAKMLLTTGVAMVSCLAMVSFVSYGVVKLWVPGWKFPVVKFPSAGQNELLAYSDFRVPSAVPEGLPVRLQIPVINVDAAIEDGLITPDGRMDVPAGSKNVSWFALGPHPGQTGSAVIGGHFGITNGVPWVFYDLDKLKVGDKIYVLDDRKDTLAFVVRSIKSFDRTDDATVVFSSNDGLAHLNLITCEGIWNADKRVYPQRLVIFTDAIPSEGPVTVAPAKNLSPPRPLALGAHGTDVTALQTTLVHEGFLIMPKKAEYGSYGTLTKVAVTQYQISVGLPTNGIFDTATRAQLFGNLFDIAAEPAQAKIVATPSSFWAVLTVLGVLLFALVFIIAACWNYRWLRKKNIKKLKK